MSTPLITLSGLTDLINTNDISNNLNEMDSNLNNIVKQFTDSNNNMALKIVDPNHFNFKDTTLLYANNYDYSKILAYNYFIDIKDTFIKQQNLNKSFYDFIQKFQQQQKDVDDKQNQNINTLDSNFHQYKIDFMSNMNKSLYTLYSGINNILFDSSNQLTIPTQLQTQDNNDYFNTLVDNQSPDSIYNKLFGSSSNNKFKDILSIVKKVCNSVYTTQPSSSDLQSLNNEITSYKSLFQQALDELNDSSKNDSELINKILEKLNQQKADLMAADTTVLRNLTNSIGPSLDSNFVACSVDVSNNDTILLKLKQALDKSNSNINTRFTNLEDDYKDKIASLVNKLGSTFDPSFITYDKTSDFNTMFNDLQTTLTNFNTNTNKSILDGDKKSLLDVANIICPILDPTYSLADMSSNYIDIKQKLTTGITNFKSNLDSSFNLIVKNYELNTKTKLSELVNQIGPVYVKNYQNCDISNYNDKLKEIFQTNKDNVDLSFNKVYTDYVNDYNNKLCNLVNSIGPVLNPSFVNCDASNYTTSLSEIFTKYKNYIDSSFNLIVQNYQKNTVDKMVELVNAIGPVFINGYISCDSSNYLNTISSLLYNNNISVIQSINTLSGMLDSNYNTLCGMLDSNYNTLCGMLDSNYKLLDSRIDASYNYLYNKYTNDIKTKLTEVINQMGPILNSDYKTCNVDNYLDTLSGLITKYKSSTDVSLNYIYEQSVLNTKNEIVDIVKNIGSGLNIDASNTNITNYKDQIKNILNNYNSNINNKIDQNTKNDKTMIINLVNLLGSTLSSNYNNISVDTSLNVVEIVNTLKDPLNNKNSIYASQSDNIKAILNLLGKKFDSSFNLINSNITISGFTGDISLDQGIDQFFNTVNAYKDSIVNQNNTNILNNFNKLSINLGGVQKDNIDGVLLDISNNINNNFDNKFKDNMNYLIKQFNKSYTDNQSDTVNDVLNSFYTNVNDYFLGKFNSLLSSLGFSTKSDDFTSCFSNIVNQIKTNSTQNFKENFDYDIIYLIKQYKPEYTRPNGATSETLLTDLFSNTNLNIENKIKNNLTALKQQLDPTASESTSLLDLINNNFNNNFTNKLKEQFKSLLHQFGNNDDTSSDDLSSLFEKLFNQVDSNINAKINDKLLEQFKNIVSNFDKSVDVNQITDLSGGVLEIYNSINKKSNDNLLNNVNQIIAQFNPDISGNSLSDGVSKLKQVIDFNSKSNILSSISGILKDYNITTSYDASNNLVFTDVDGSNLSFKNITENSNSLNILNIINNSLDDNKIYNNNIKDALERYKNLLDNKITNQFSKQFQDTLNTIDDLYYNISSVRESLLSDEKSIIDRVNYTENKLVDLHDYIKNNLLPNYNSLLSDYQLLSTNFVDLQKEHVDLVNKYNLLINDLNGLNNKWITVFNEDDKVQNVKTFNYTTTFNSTIPDLSMNLTDQLDLTLSDLNDVFKSSLINNFNTLRDYIYINCQTLFNDRNLYWLQSKSEINNNDKSKLIDEIKNQTNDYIFIMPYFDKVLSLLKDYFVELYHNQGVTKYDAIIYFNYDLSNLALDVPTTASPDA